MQQWILSPPMREDDVHRVQDQDEEPLQSPKCRAQWKDDGCGCTNEKCSENWWDKGELRMRLQVGYPGVSSIGVHIPAVSNDGDNLLSRESHSLEGKQKRNKLTKYSNTSNTCSFDPFSFKPSRSQPLQILHKQPRVEETSPANQLLAENTSGITSVTTVFRSNSRLKGRTKEPDRKMKSGIWNQILKDQW